MENINYNIVSLIDFLGLIQGLFLGIILIFGNKKNRPSILLGLFLIIFSIELLDPILRDLNLKDHYPILLFLPINFNYLTVPLFYIYVKRITNPRLSRKDYLILIPGIIEFVTFFILFILSNNTKLTIHNNSITTRLIDVYELLALLYAIYFAIKILIYLNEYKKNVENYYSNVDGRLLNWAGWVALFIIVQEVWLILIFNNDNDFEDYNYVLVSLVNVVFIFWAGISGLRQSKFLTSSQVVSIDGYNFINTRIEKVPLQNSLPESEDYRLLKKLMQEKQLYKEPDLSLADLSKELNLSQKNLSQLINQQSNKNFNKFVNQYRIEEAKRLLKDESNNNLNMLGIAYKSGFNSKASFYAVFKQFTQTTPNAFKKR